MVTNTLRTFAFLFLFTCLACEKDDHDDQNSALHKIEIAINSAHINSVNTWNMYGAEKWSNWYATNAYAEDGFLIVPRDDGIKTFNLMTANFVDVSGNTVDLYY